MKIKLLIIEFDYHSEVLRDLCLMCDNSAFEITVFTSEKIWKSTGIDPNNIEGQVRLKAKDHALKDFIRQNKPDIESSDIILFNTCASNFKCFSQVEFNAPTILRIHNYNSYFETIQNLKLNLKSWRYDLEHIFYRSLWRRDWYYRRKLLKRIDYFMFPSEAIASYAQKRGKIPIEQILPGIPYTFSQTFAPAQPAEVIITVVGTVEEKRRNYDDLIRALTIASPNFNEPVKLVLLGKLKGSYGQHVKSKLSALSSPKLQIVTFEQFVPQATYDEIMVQSSFQVVPINPETRYQICSEKYGLTKISGAENEMIKYQLHSVFPTGYLVPDELKPLSSNYSSTRDLAKRIEELVNQKKFSTTHIPDFSKKRLQKELLKICNLILTTRED